MKLFLTLAALTLAAMLPARAADYAIQKTFWNATSITNNAGVVTNLAATIDVTQFADFTLHVVLGFTNASAGTYDIAWTCSGDGNNFVSAPAAPGASGWFSIPLTNGGTVVTWVTNITTINAIGYWQIKYATNKAVQHLTNGYIVGWVKPKRTNRDF